MSTIPIVRHLCESASIANLLLSFVLKLYRNTEVEHLFVSHTIVKPFVRYCLVVSIFELPYISIACCLLLDTLNKCNLC